MKTVGFETALLLAWKIFLISSEKELFVSRIFNDTFSIFVFFEPVTKRKADNSNCPLKLHL